MQNKVSIPVLLSILLASGCHNPNDARRVDPLSDYLSEILSYKQLDEEAFVEKEENLEDRMVADKNVSINDLLDILISKGATASEVVVACNVLVGKGHKFDDFDLSKHIANDAYPDKGIDSKLRRRAIITAYMRSGVSNTAAYRELRDFFEIEEDEKLRMNVMRNMVMDSTDDFGEYLKSSSLASHYAKAMQALK